MLDKFGLLDVRFNTLVREVNAPGVSQVFRAQGFYRFAADVLRFFDRHPSLQSLKLMSVVIPEITKEHDIDIRLRHHVKLSLLGLEPERLVAHLDRYVLEALPYHTMGQGIFELHRDHAWITDYRELDPAQETDYLNLINTMALDIDAAFGSIQVYHDLGLTSAVP